MKGIYKIVTSGAERPGSAGPGIQGTRWQVFRAVFSARLGSLVKTNLWMMLFALPAIAVFFINLSENALAAASLPFASNAGAGYPYFDDVAEQAKLIVYQNGVRLAYLLIPALIIAAVGLAGGMHVSAMLLSGENIPVTKYFFRGIKRNALQFAVAAVLPAGAAGLTAFYFAYMPVSSITPFLSITLFTAIVLLFVLALFFTMYLLTQIENYTLRPWPFVKNGVAFALGGFLQNAFFLVISLVPLSAILLLSGSAFLSFAAIFVVGLFGFSWPAFLWTVHTRHVYQSRFGTPPPAADAAAVTAEPERGGEAAPAEGGNQRAGASAGSAGNAYRRGNQKKHRKKGKKR